MKIIDDYFDLNKINKYPTLMALGNGYLGMRSVQEEPYYDQHYGMYMAGVYNKNKDSESSELVNLPDILAMKLKINGDVFSLQDKRVTKYKRFLNMATGELRREVQWESGENKLLLVFKRVLGQKNHHILGQRLELTSINGHFIVTAETGIDAQKTNYGTQQYRIMDKRVFKGRRLYGKYETFQSGIELEIQTKFNLTGDYYAKNRQLLGKFVVDVPDQGRAYFEKLALIQRSDGDAVINEAQKTVFLKETTDYDFVMKDSADAFKTYWDNHRIEVLSKDPTDQMALDFALYHLKIMAPHNPEASVGAKGLTGEGYKGHVFWDTEIFILPVYLFTEPHIARDLLIYRYERLTQAIEKARVTGYEGALFPWESAHDGREETPKYGGVNIKTGQRQEVASAQAEHHIVADIAFAVDYYVQITGDKDFLNQYGKELIYQTARFWLSRAVERNDRLEIHNVIGPDEYTEFVDNNAFTNYLAKHNIDLAMKYRVGDDDFQRACRNFAQRIYLPQPNQEGIIPQDDTFLSKPAINLAKYKKEQGKQTILLDYSRAEVNDMQILKQADVVMLNYLLPELFEDEVKAINLKYYEEHTIHDSSLSKAIHAIEAIHLNQVEFGYQLFQEAALIDLGPDADSSNDGVHAASLAALWKTIVFGFLDVQVKNGKLSLNPRLPKAWKELKMSVQVTSYRIHIKLTREELVLEKETYEPLNMSVHGRYFTLMDYLKLDLSHLGQSAGGE